MWEDKKYFFQALEESITGLDGLSDDDQIKVRFKGKYLRLCDLPKYILFTPLILDELKSQNQTLENFKLKLGYKNLIINLCNELQKTNLEEFNQHSASTTTTIQTIPDQNETRTTEVCYNINFKAYYPSLITL